MFEYLVKARLPWGTELGLDRDYLILGLNNNEPVT